MMRLLFATALIFTAIVSSHSQENLTTKSKKAQKFYEDAIDNFALQQYEKSIELLDNAINEDKKFVEAWLTKAEVYMSMGEDSAAISTYKKCIELGPDFFPGMYLNIGDLEFLNGKYSDAKPHYEKYLSYPSIPERTRRMAMASLASCEFSIWAVNNPVPFDPQNMGSSINNKYDQYWPSISVDEHTFIFTLLAPKDSTNPRLYGNRQEDFYVSTYGYNGWKQARSVGMPLNTADNEGAQTLSADGQEMYFTACNRKGGYGLCDLYYSKWIGNQWSIPKNVGAPVNSKSKETQPSLSPDGRTLYFASNRPGGKGGLDLWQSTLQSDSTWSEPVNLGDSINTTGEEQSPFIHPDNTTLYFSSTGLPGLGRFDLFFTKKNNDGHWSKPVNLGYPLNTHFNEEGLIVNAKGNTAYYSSTRAGGYGGRDLYQFKLYEKAQPNPVSYMKGTVYDESTKKPLLARFELIDLETANVVMQSYSRANDGTFLISIPSGKDYALNVNKSGYIFFSENFTMTHTDNTQPYLMDVPLKPLKVGGKVILKNIFFDTNQFSLKKESKVELDRLVILLKENPALKIQILGHTDNIGTPENNKLLSENRANTVVLYLTQNGIESTRLTARGMGQTQPIASNDSEEGKAKNRRTEFMIVK